jgi:hypothetical protein
MASTALTISMSLSALALAGAAMWRAESHASPRAARPAEPVTAVPAPAVAPVTPVVAAVAAAAAAPAAAPRPVEGPLTVRRLTVGTAVVDREATGHASEYELASDTRLCAVVELANRGAASGVRVRFEPEGDAARSVGHVRLAAPSAPRWRTWGCSERVRTPGTWSAVVETLDGRELAREVFTVR